MKEITNTQSKKMAIYFYILTKKKDDKGGIIFSKQLCTCCCQVCYSFYEIQRHFLEQLITQFSKQVHPSDKTSFLLVLLMTQRFLLSVVSTLISSYKLLLPAGENAASVRYSQGKLMQFAKCLLNVIYMSNDVRNKHTFLGCTIKCQIYLEL